MECNNACAERNDVCNEWIDRIQLDNELKMTSNWENDFDFEDAVVSKPKLKTKKDISKEIDFFDVQDDKPSLKLPTINVASNRPITKSKIQALDQEFPFLYEEDYDLNSRKQIANALPNKIKPIAKKQSDQEEFYQSLEELKNIPKKTKDIYQSKLMNEADRSIKQQSVYQKSTPPLQDQNKEDVYQEQVYEDYDQDFDFVAQNTSKQGLNNNNAQSTNDSKNINNKKQKVKSKTKTDIKQKVEIQSEGKDYSKAKIPPKAESKTKIGLKGEVELMKRVSLSREKQETKSSGLRVNVRNANIAIQKGDNRPSSKKSIASSASRKQLPSGKKVEDETRDKHRLLAERLLKDENVEDMNYDKLTRLNEKVRCMIKKFNEELNEQLQRNLVHIKDNKVQKQTNVEEKIKILEEQVKSGKVNMDTMKNQLDRLQGREGEVKEEEFEIIMEKRIQQCKEKIKQISKDIQKAKHDVSSGGNKLSKQENQRRQAQQVHQLKTLLIQSKKDQEKNQLRISKLEATVTELSSKVADKDYQMENQVDQAREKGIALQRIDNTKNIELKHKVTSLETHCRKIQTLNKTKCQHIEYQNNQLQNNIKIIEQQINNLYKSIELSHEQAVILLTRAKQNPQLSNVFSENISKMLRVLQENQPTNQEIKSEGDKSRISSKPLKNSLQPNAKGPQINSTPIFDNMPISKPNFLKKNNPNHHDQNNPNNRLEQKQKIINKLNDNQYQRIWQDDKKQSLQSPVRNIIKPSEQPKVQIEQDKNKPFVLKKYRKTEVKIEAENKQQSKTQIAIETNQIKEQVSNAPKFRLNRKKDKAQITLQQQTHLTQPKIERIIEKQIQKEDEMAVVGPRRLMPRKAKEQSYIPTMDRSTEQNKGKMNYKEEHDSKQNVIATHINVPQHVPQDIAKDISNDIPAEGRKITLRLRDRKKVEATVEKLEIQEQSIKEEYDPLAFLKNKALSTDKKELNKQVILDVNKQQSPVQFKKNYTLQKQQTIIQITKDKQLIKNNPYVVKEEGAPKRQRQGPIKKFKIQKPVGKINIFQQAEDLTEPINKKNIQAPYIEIKKEENLDLNAMLGIKQKTKHNDLDDLLKEAPKIIKKEKKRTDDFFNDLEI